MVKEGRFREDLYYRLNVLSFDLPALRERKDDIVVLIEFFTDFFARVHNKNNVVITSSGMDVLVNYGWPGNIRELKNIVERLVITSQGLSIGRFEALMVLGAVPVLEEPTRQYPENDMLLESKQKELITLVLEETKGNKTAAAKKLGISRATLHRKLREMRKNG